MDYALFKEIQRISQFFGLAPDLDTLTFVWISEMVIYHYSKLM